MSENVPEKPKKRIGRPPKPTRETHHSVSLYLPPSLIEQMGEQVGSGSYESLSAFARVAIGDYLKKLERRKERESGTIS